LAECTPARRESKRRGPVPRVHSQHDDWHNEEELAAAKSFLDEQGVNAELVPAIGEPAVAIVRLAEERDADLVVVGTCEVNVIQRLLGQSVSQEVARRIHRDVLIVHPARH
jgi:nucleotide-binding universal stress UspA family protein